MLRIFDAEIGLRVDVQPDPMPVTDVLVAGALVYERHPRLGWQIQHAPRRRGYPLHLMHSCPRQPRTKARAA